MVFRRSRVICFFTAVPCIQDAHIGHDDFRDVPGGPILFPGPGVLASFDIDQFSFGQVLAADFRKLSKGHDPMPFRDFFFFSSGFVFPGQSADHGKAGDGEPVFGAFGFRVPS